LQNEVNFVTLHCFLSVYGPALALACLQTHRKILITFRPFLQYSRYRHFCVIKRPRSHSPAKK